MKTTAIAFVPALLDDYGLDPIEFRLYCHIARRAGANGICWESAATMAQTCGIGERTVRSKLRSLAARNMITRHSRPGRTPEIRLTSPEVWSPRQQSAGVGGEPPRQQTAPHPGNRCRTPRQQSAGDGIPSMVPPDGSPFKEKEKGAIAQQPTAGSTERPPLKIEGQRQAERSTSVNPLSPEEDKGFREFVTAKVKRFPNPPRSVPCVVDAWIRKQGALLLAEYRASLRPPAPLVAVEPVECVSAPPVTPQEQEKGYHAARLAARWSLRTTGRDAIAAECRERGIECDPITGPIAC